MLKGFLGYQTDRITVGLEPFRQIIRNRNAPDITRTGTAVFARGPVAENTFVFARTDFYNPDARRNSLREMFFLAGMDFRLAQGVALIPNVWINTYIPDAPNVPDRKTDVVVRITSSFRLH
jgi:hypothetical protein